MPLVTLPAPFLGWNTVDSVAEIPPGMASTLDNIFPSTSSCNSRKGISEYATSLGSGNVDSLFELKAANVNKFISASSGNIYDISSSGAGTLLASGFSSNQWQASVFNAQLGLVNGTDAPQVYDGSTVSAMTVSGSGLTITNLNSMLTFKNRTYFTELNSQDFWYSALSTLGGVLTKFPLSKVGNFGGNLIAIQGLTNDGGGGQDDYLCFFMSTGEIIIYSGTDPSSDFSLIGIFYAGRPLSTRGIIKFGADIFFITNNGYHPISSLLPLSYGKDNSGLSKYIKGAASSSAQSFSASFGWQAILAPAENFLLVNVPQSNGQFVQHVLNVNTNAWCRFTGIQARCWGIFGNTLYCGGTDGKVYMYGPNYLDGTNTPIVQTYIPGYMNLQALTKNPLSSGGSQITRTTAIRPRIRFDSQFSLTLSASVDFKPYTTPYTLTFPSIGCQWGDPWGSPWAQTNSFINFLSFNTLGYNVAVKMVFSCSSATEFYETNFLIQTGSRI